jgi:hypothetical protein
MLRGLLGPVGSMWCWAALVPGVWLAWFVGLAVRLHAAPYDIRRNFRFSAYKDIGTA